MRTDELITAMAADTERTTPPGVVLPFCLLAVAAILAAVFLPLMGLRPDVAGALMQLRVEVKQAYPLILGLGAFGAGLRLARPGLDVGPWRYAIFFVPLLLAAAVAVELMTLPRQDWRAAFVGQSSWQCLALIGAMSLPVLAVSLWALRRGASTRPTLSGTLAGLLSGSTAATVYAFHCTEDSPLFYGFWYVIAILMATALGAALGRRLLRW